MAYGSTAYPNATTSLGREVGIIAGMTPAPRFKVGGVFIDYAFIIPALVGYTIAGSGKYVDVGNQVVRYGTCLCRLTSTANGGKIGTFVPYSKNQANTTLTSGGTVAGVSSLVLPAALAIYPGDVLTIDTSGQLEQVLVQSYNATTGVLTLAAATTYSGTVFTGVTTLTHANAVQIVKTDDGRGTLRRGECFLANMSGYGKTDIFNTDGHGLLDGGIVYLARVASDFGSAGVATNPTRAQLETGMPAITWVLD